MKQSEGQSCKTCRYHKPRGIDHITFSPNDEEFPNVTGFCNRYPPALFTFSERMGSVPGVTDNH